MQSSNDFICMDCRENFDCASELLKHFAQHVSADILNDLKNSEQVNKKPNVPDLYPINIYKQMQNGENGRAKEADGFNPLRFCEVTMNDNLPSANERAEDDADTDSSSSEYKCKFCGYTCVGATLLRSHMRYHKHVKASRLPDLNPMKMKSRKQEKCNIKRKMYGTKLPHQSNELLCT